MSFLSLRQGKTANTTHRFQGELKYMIISLDSNVLVSVLKRKHIYYKIYKKLLCYQETVDG